MELYLELQEELKIVVDLCSKRRSKYPLHVLIQLTMSFGEDII